ncbi:dihydrolipoamide acetyltransferase family protein [Mycolicibacterium komossense]|uniref:Dihydrolipoamide acetyltransferase component of pyruvate dehydrogenase complex n=1 Tax=Mycolicibacterium komossense TaxID=1779 RepID=A0ABT3CFR0_9MYCO|nr:dihydrolipoamide acetyltransferase family protein [Mycolicibacterium komossense]MCV7228076.1 2-oxo acid dehydrogenase subunit E2 [Mycolicibacterium komossense]
MTTSHRFALPDIGEGLTEAEIITWHVAVGDTVAVNDILVEVETAKASVELPSPYAGLIAELHAKPGDAVEVGTVIVSFADPSGSTDPDPISPAVPASERPAPDLRAEGDDAATTRPSVLVGYGPSRVKVERRQRKLGYRAPGPTTPLTDGPRAPYATPPVRTRAKSLGIDLAEVIPTGDWGQITHRDLAAASGALHTRPDGAVAQSEPAETRVPVKGVRKLTAEAMVASAFTAPHVTEWVTIDITESCELLEQLRTRPEFAGLRITPLLLVIRAALSALRAHPEMNAKWDGETGEIVRYRDVNLGIAAATPRGLLVPNIKAAQTLTSPELCHRLAELVTDARDGKTRPEAMARGTFTITNIGVFGVDGGTPILNPGEAGILCVGQIVRRPWEHRGEIALRSVCTLSLSFDHRLVDGQLGSQVLAHIARLLTDPSLALAI